MSHVQVDLTDPTLFGNDAAEDEASQVFNSYVVDRPETAAFLDGERRLAIIRAYKGEGKSALLRLVRDRLGSEDSKPIIVHRTALNLAPKVMAADYPSWVRGWKDSIVAGLAQEIGVRIGVAWGGDSIALVEEAERVGFKQRNFISAVLQRLIPSIQIAGATIKLPEGQAIPNAEPLIKRWLEGRPGVWLFVDDADKNFENTPDQRARVASFFDACRELLQAIPELRIRAAIRPNVWVTLQMHYESMSHVGQYVYSLSWSEDQIRRLIARRVEGYLKRKRLWQGIVRRLPSQQVDREKVLISFVFESAMNWGRSARPPHVVLYTLSKHRPRWVVELAKVAAERAAAVGRGLITLDDIVSNLEAFGERRVRDTIAEFAAQCPEIDELITAFVRQPEEFTTAELLTLIDNRILSHLNPRIAGVVGKASNREVARFLFEVGLFYGRRDLPDGSYEHVSFEKNPTLFRSRTAVDAGLKWEIHPVFRQALEMRDVMGKELRNR